MKSAKDIMYRQCGFRFYWTGGHNLFVETPDGNPVAYLYVGDPLRSAVTISDVEKAIDKFCGERKQAVREP